MHKQVELNLLAKGSGHGKFFWFCTTYHDKSFNRLKNTRFCTEGNNKPSPDCPSSSSICINFQHRSLSPLRSYRSSCGNTCKVFHATCTIINEVILHLWMKGSGHVIVWYYECLVWTNVWVSILGWKFWNVVQNLQKSRTLHFKACPLLKVEVNLERNSRCTDKLQTHSINTSMLVSKVLTSIFISDL